jgi:hypothetical protein
MNDKLRKLNLEKLNSQKLMIRLKLFKVIAYLINPSSYEVELRLSFYHLII